MSTSFYEIQQKDYSGRLYKDDLKNKAVDALERGHISRDIYNVVMNYIDSKISLGEYILLTKAYMAVHKEKYNEKETNNSCTSK